MPPKNASENSTDMNLALVNPVEPEEQDITYGLSDFGVETQDGILHRTQAENEVRSILTSLRPRKNKVQARDVVYMDFYDDAGNKVTQGIPIRSVPGHIAVEIRSDIVAPEYPQKRDPLTKEIIEDRSHPDYVKAQSEMMELDYRIRCLTILHGLDIDIYDADDEDKIVWSRDRKIQDVEAAIYALEVMGFTSPMMQKLNDEISRISGFVQQIENEELEKKS